MEASGDSESFPPRSWPLPPVVGRAGTAGGLPPADGSAPSPFTGLPASACLLVTPKTAAGTGMRLALSAFRFSSSIMTFECKKQGRTMMEMPWVCVLLIHGFTQQTPTVCLSVPHVYSSRRDTLHSRVCETHHAHLCHPVSDTVDQFPRAGFSPQA